MLTKIPPLDLIVRLFNLTHDVFSLQYPRQAFIFRYSTQKFCTHSHLLFFKTGHNTNNISKQAFLELNLIVIPV